MYIKQKRPNLNTADLSIFSTSFGHFDGALGLDLWSMQNHEWKSGHMYFFANFIEQTLLFLFIFIAKIQVEYFLNLHFGSPIVITKCFNRPERLKNHSSCNFIVKERKKHFNVMITKIYLVYEIKWIF